MNVALHLESDIDASWVKDCIMDCGLFSYRAPLK